jgi:hypothetical protein
MTKPKQPRPRPPQTEKPQTPFWVAVARQRRPRRITDMNPLPKGGRSV